VLGLQVENSNVCNAKCVWCPYQEHTRKREIMGFDLHKKIVDEASTIPLIEQFTITGLGEPTLDKGLWDKIAYSRKKLHPKTEISVYTNGSTLTKEIIQRFQDSGLSCLYVSLNAVDRLKRREVMGLDDYDTVEPVLLDAIKEGTGRMNIVISAVHEKDLFDGEEIKQFIDKWGGVTQEKGHAFLHLEGNWAGWNYKARTTQRNICFRCTNNIMVLSDGRVSLCCQDYNGEVTFGDLHTETLREIYQKEGYVKYRKMHFENKRNELQLCKTCVMI
jgi:radical SAM protein with 4Fe4S-binding SPASM domain